VVGDSSRRRKRSLSTKIHTAKIQKMQSHKYARSSVQQSVVKESAAYRDVGGGEHERHKRGRRVLNGCGGSRIMRTHVSGYRKKAAVDGCHTCGNHTYGRRDGRSGLVYDAAQNIKKFSMRSEGVNRPEYSAADKEARLSLNLSYYNTFSISVEVM
jgi:hypothetical protein